ncbi:helix-turn-helix domain-containing protein [Micromonospora sp. NPDC049114]|uniref:helix-turn-helix domain-containing protein n=1 Tax=unclassified Micromonospora TaxID=2617518 RepID=UPI0033DCC128
MRWRTLPGTLDQHAHLLVVRLRQLKDHSGLSLKALGTKTAFSASSWERYLNGKALPPETAVVALAEITRADPVPLLALLAASQRVEPPSTEVPASGDAHGPEPDRAEPRVRVAALSVAGGALLLSAVTSILLLVDPWREDDPAVATDVGRYACTYTQQGDLLFAGNSTTTSHLVMRNSTGPDAAEVQCLLRRHNLSPGEVDGYFGEHTEAEVKRLQLQDHLPADGIVSQQTWQLLRHVR